MGIAAVIIAYNEEKNIKKCLESVKWADEIIVVDSFSTDKTFSISKKYADKVFNIKWMGFSKTKNFGISKARSEWILSLDADEIVSENLKKEILKTVKSTDLNGFFIPRKPFFMNRFIKHCGWYPSCQLRLFKKTKGKFDESKMVHENVKITGKAGYLKNDLLHYPYENIGKYFDHLNRYTNLAAESMRLKNKKAGFLNLIFHPFFTFFKMYFIKLGVLDGLAGFTVCVLSSFYNFVKYAKLWELRRRT